MSRRFIAFILASFIIVGGGFLFVLKWGSQMPSASDLFGGAAPGPAPSYARPAPPPPPAPSVTLSIILSQKGNKLYVQWANLPGNTAALDIFRSTKGKNDWKLWKTITIAPGQLASGNSSFDIGSNTFSNFSFYVQATGGGGSGGNGTSTIPSTILWVSSSTTPTVTTSTPPDLGNGGNNGGNGTSTTTNGNTTTPSSTGNGNNTNGTTTGSGGSSTSVPAGNPYYTPALQISGYKEDQAGNFWVQHIDKRIQIGWQNLPPQTTEIAIFRGANQDGPWVTVLTQQNPVGNYSIQIADDTLGQPYYYKMEVLAGASTIGTFGPAYLPPL